MASNRIFGVTSTLSGLADGLVVNNITHNYNTETAEARNEKGQIIDMAAFSKSEDISLDGLWVGNGIQPGVVVSVGDKNYLVTASTKTESNTDFQKGSVTARTADEAELWPLSSIVGE